MVKAQEIIRKRLFFISWTVKKSDVNSTDGVSVEELITNLPTDCQPCTLTWRIEHDSIILLKMKTSDPSESSRRVVVSVRNNGVKKEMMLNGTKKNVWIADIFNRWNSQLNEPTVRNTGRDHGLERTSSFLSSSDFTFEIFIDLKPDSEEKGAKHVLKNLEKLWEDKTLSDVTFKCGDEVIEAHASILASGSPVFAAMFQNDCKEKQERIVLIEDIEAKVLENLLHYIYVGKCPFLEKGKENASEVTDLLVAADKYSVESLKEECELYLSLTLAVGNATQYLVLSHLYNSSKLQETTLTFMAKNAKAVCSRKDWMKMMKNYPELCFKATQLIVGLCHCQSANRKKKTLSTRSNLLLLDLRP